MQCGKIPGCRLPVPLASLPLVHSMRLWFKPSSAKMKGSLDDEPPFRGVSRTDYQTPQRPGVSTALRLQHLQIPQIATASEARLKNEMEILT